MFRWPMRQPEAQAKGKVNDDHIENEAQRAEEAQVYAQLMLSGAGIPAPPVPEFGQATIC